ncbi:hypothetical protein A4S06_04930 [Erysipelotrichaceae bacterium MTC7]|nr:hypothetical protein A4S06_04930 [Erysipelotrichaceae bacterium MTC7]
MRKPSNLLLCEDYPISTSTTIIIYFFEKTRGSGQDTVKSDKIYKNRQKTQKNAKIIRFLFLFLSDKLK